MDSVVNIVKQLLSSKITCAAALFTATIFQFGPLWVDGIPELPEGWRWTPAVVMLFTGFVCAWWLISWTFHAVRWTLVTAWKALLPVRWRNLTQEEKYLLGFAAARNGFVDMDELAWMQGPDRITASVAAKGLVRYGLMTQGMMGYQLTDMGERFVQDHMDRIRQT